MKQFILIMSVLLGWAFQSENIYALTGGRTLIVYFSEGGNTRGIAEEIQSQIGADLVEIEMEEPYSDSYSVLLEQAEQDLLANARPALRTRIENMEAYDTILLGYPNWYAILPMPVYTFLESYDFDGKRIIPFCSHGNGMMGETISNICKTCPYADVREALSVTYSGGPSLSEEIHTWLAKHGLVE